MPTIGLGIDFQHRDSYEKSLPELLKHLKGRLSHLSIVGLQNATEISLFTALSGDLPVLHHFTGVAPAGVNGVNTAELKRQVDISNKLNAIWCLEDIGIWNIGPYNIPYCAPPVLCSQVLEKTISGVKEILQQASIPFLAELPSCSFMAGNMRLEDFFTQLIERTNCGMVLDVSHVFSYAIYTDTHPADVLRNLPLAHVVEIHVAGGSVHPKHAWRYRDTHTEPVLVEINHILRQAIELCPNLRAITYEIGAGMPLDLMEEELGRLEHLCVEQNFTPRIEKEIAHEIR